MFKGWQFPNLSIILGGGVGLLLRFFAPSAHGVTDHDFAQLSEGSTHGQHFMNRN